MHVEFESPDHLRYQEFASIVKQLLFGGRGVGLSDQQNADLVAFVLSFDPESTGSVSIHTVADHLCGIVA